MVTNIEALLTESGAWRLDPSRSTVGFSIKNFWGLLSVKGKFTDVNGDGQISGGSAILGHLDINVASLRTGIGKRDAHLRSADFFDAERHPEIRVEVTGIDPGAGEAAHLHATFSIKGVTAPVALPVQISTLDGGAVRVTGQTVIDRDQFDIRWNQLGMVAKAATVSADVYFVPTPQ